MHRHRTLGRLEIPETKKGAAFLIVHGPGDPATCPVVVSVPHYGTAHLPGISAEDYADPTFATLAYGYADTFAAELYGDLHEAGATLLATPYSRLFVDVNRRRDDFEVDGDQVRSRRGVFRTHTTRDEPIFARPLSPSGAESRLAAFYDPYHHALNELVAATLRCHDRILVLDLHTASPRGMGSHQVVVGTRHGTTCHPELSRRVATRFAAHGFEPHHNVSGYTGAHIVRRLGMSQGGRVHAIQIEVNASLLLHTSHRGFINQVTQGQTPEKNERNLARLRACLHEAIPELGALVATLA